MEKSTSSKKKPEKREGRIYLATKRTEPKGVQKTSSTNFTGISNSFSRPGLWTLIQEHNLGTVYDIRLNTSYVYVLLYLTSPHNIMI